MSIFVDRSTRVIVQGITGRDGSFHARQMMAYGTTVVGGVTPGKGGRKFKGPKGESAPVFDTVEEAVNETGADASVIYVPPAFAADAVVEAADAGIRFVVCVTEGIPVLDMTRAHAFARDRDTRVLGPNCPGIICPGETKLGIIPGEIAEPGPVGLVSRSGTLTYEAVYHLTAAGLGQTTCVGIGGDPLVGTDFVDCLEAFAGDGDTEVVVIIGEIGGTAEQEAAAWAKRHLDVPMVGFVAGRTAPPGKRMGHAGAIVDGSAGTAAEKMQAFEDNGVRVAERPVDIVALVEDALDR